MFQSFLQKELLKTQDLTNSDELNEALIKSYRKAAEETIPGQIKPIKKEWISETTKMLIKQKHQQRSLLKDGNVSDGYKILKKECRKAISRDKRSAIDSEIEALEKIPPGKRYFELIKKLFKKKKVISWSMKSENGKILNNKEDMLKVWKDFYKDLYHHQDTDYKIEVENEPEIPEFTLGEIQNATSKLKTGKATGRDNVCAEFIKNG